MSSSMICTQQTIFVRETYVGQETCIWGICEEIDLSYLGVGGKVLLKLILLL